MANRTVRPYHIAGPPIVMKKNKHGGMVCPHGGGEAYSTDKGPIGLCPACAIVVEEGLTIDGYTPVLLGGHLQYAGLKD